MRRSWLAAALLLGVLVGCAPAPQSGNILLRGNGPEPDSLDPQKARTVESHVANILSKLGVPSRAKAKTIALRLNLVENSESRKR